MKLTFAAFPIRLLSKWQVSQGTNQYSSFWRLYVGKAGWKSSSRDTSHMTSELIGSL